jgi:hypothetical protein
MIPDKQVFFDKFTTDFTFSCVRGQQVFLYN